MEWDSKDYQERAEQVLLHTYRRFPVVFERGEGVRLYDLEGREYLDFGSGIGVNALGYGNSGYTEALKRQTDRLLHISNLYYQVPMVEAAEQLAKASGLDRIFFTNSGTEAVEGAIKAARKYAWSKDGTTDHEIIAMKRSFHGRSLGALSVTGNQHYQEPFKPLIGGIKFADFNALDSVKSQITDKTCGIILETIQGEGGVYPADSCFLRELRELCDEQGILLILDEIQCGMGRTGTMFAYQEYGIKPDIMTTAKALGCGVPVGAFAMTKEVAEKSLEPGDHGSTYGGNPLVCAAVKEVFTQFENQRILSHVRELTPYFEDKLDKLVEKYDFLRERRGKGFLQGIQLEGRSAGEIVLRAMEQGLLLLSAGDQVLRFLPPLIITKADVDEMIQKLEESF